MSTWTLGALVGPVWIAKRATDYPAMSPFPIIVLLCGLVVPMLLARLDLPTPVSTDHSSFDRRYFWAETESISPLLANAQIKRVAASRNIPYFVVHQLVDENSLDAREVNLTALNLALDRHDQNK
jgi:hypothetical protein